jgi:hypothetical protein
VKYETLCFKWEKRIHDFVLVVGISPDPFDEIQSVNTFSPEVIDSDKLADYANQVENNFAKSEEQRTSQVSVLISRVYQML